ncbi:hypothetical protein GRF29_103g1129156 [Pseudopithomyces chartarum]|uniref:Uncharacterized protein n=1 Tax=Pseudopithomyces chartarum TaxID=1892770 RepID=A0AAN6LTU9_9PLEO|nr:hypothetical protein GRF29_103g1129156 [Pseudopithomyces chartarum]
MDGQSGSEAHLWADWQDVSRLMFIAPGAARCDDWGAEAELIELLTLRWLWRMRAAGRAAAMRRCDDATMRWGVDYTIDADGQGEGSSRSSGRAASTQGPATSCPSRYKRALPRLKPRPRCAGSAAGAALLQCAAPAAAAAAAPPPPPAAFLLQALGPLTRRSSHSHPAAAHASPAYTLELQPPVARCPVARCPQLIPRDNPPVRAQHPPPAAASLVRCSHLSQGPPSPHRLCCIEPRLASAVPRECMLAYADLAIAAHDHPSKLSQRCPPNQSPFRQRRTPGCSAHTLGFPPSGRIVMP